MSASAAALTAEEYELRKNLLNDIGRLSPIEQKEVFRIIKESGVEFSENHNGVFFDVSKLPVEAFNKIRDFINFCKKNGEDFAAREGAERLAQEALLN